jgi:hypothetical protein
MIRCTVKGDFKKTRNVLKRALKLDFNSLLEKYAEEGVEALKAATPVVTGKTAESWGYEIVEEPGRISIYWTNSNVVNYIPIAIVLDYGHATGNGGYVQGRHYISPAIQPIFDKIADAAWKEVTKQHAK